MSKELDRLRALLAEATPRPWHEPAPDAGWSFGPATSADDALIVALRNAAPELLALVEAAENVRLSALCIPHSPDAAVPIEEWDAMLDAIAALKAKLAEVER